MGLFLSKWSICGSGCGFAYYDGCFFCVGCVVSALEVVYEVVGNGPITGPYPYIPSRYIPNNVTGPTPTWYNFTVSAQ